MQIKAGEGQRGYAEQFSESQLFIVGPVKYKQKIPKYYVLVPHDIMMCLPQLVEPKSDGSTD
jgi:hypothetical protein